MTNNYSMENLLEFLEHAADKGLMPAATARAFAVAARNVFGVLQEDERNNIPLLDLDAIIRRFNNKRARDFNPRSLSEYARRVRRAVELYEQWRENPAGFSVKTRSTRKSGKSQKAATLALARSAQYSETQFSPNCTGGYQSSFPVGPGRVITLSNIPEDLTSAEAEKLAQFVRMLAVD